MVMLLEQDIQTKEVLGWKGLHLLHYIGSSCSQKTRIFLQLKGVEWTSRHIDVPKRENYGDWYMGINPRGLVPVLVDDGQVIIESNDIIEHLERKFPEPALIPAERDEEAIGLLKEEDDLHLDLRTISFRYVLPQGKLVRGDDVLRAYEANGAGTVRGERDAHKDVELKFFRDLQANGAITDEQVRRSVGRFRRAFEGLETRLASRAHLLGQDVSVVDIAWYVYAARLTSAGYPLHRLHPRVGAWFDRLDAQPAFHAEVAAPPPVVAMREAMHREHEARGQSLVSVAGL
ncbi:MAG: glutathione S-transferase family protein [Caulobacterales bacterium]|nr:glutathione S-transferase family protein [Caulobacterales bacterium]